jgi:5-methylcytosine-specific restriction endonuclease McrA
MNANQKAKKLGLDECILASQIERLFDSHGWSCYYCGLQSVDHGVMTLDHFIPFMKGGSNTIQNCVPACFGCNASKGDRDPREFILPITGETK